MQLHLDSPSDSRSKEEQGVGYLVHHTYGKYAGSLRNTLGAISSPSVRTQCSLSPSLSHVQASAHRLSTQNMNCMFCAIDTWCRDQEGHVIRLQRDSLRGGTSLVSPEIQLYSMGMAAGEHSRH